MFRLSYLFHLSLFPISSCSVFLWIKHLRFHLIFFVRLLLTLFTVILVVALMFILSIFTILYIQVKLYNFTYKNLTIVHCHLFPPRLNAFVFRNFTFLYGLHKALLFLHKQCSFKEIIVIKPAYVFSHVVISNVLYSFM